MKLSSFTQRSFHLFRILPLLCHQVAANTEIINFSPSRERRVDLPLGGVGNWSRLHPSDNERRWTLEPAALHTPFHQVCEQDDKIVIPSSCPHELWLLLDLDDEKWASHSTFTLRLSWPASTPADFMIAMYSPQDLLARLSSERDPIETTPGLERTHAHTSSTRHIPTTRSRYARIRAVHAGVPTPGFQSHPATSQPRVPVPVPRLGSDVVVDERGKESVSFIVILEPVYLGVLPATLLSTVGFLIPIVLAAALLVPFVIAYFRPFIRQAGEDLNAGMTRTRKER